MVDLQTCLIPDGWLGWTTNGEEKTRGGKERKILLISSQSRTQRLGWPAHGEVCPPYVNGWVSWGCKADAFPGASVLGRKCLPQTGELQPWRACQAARYEVPGTYPKEQIHATFFS